MYFTPNECGFRSCTGSTHLCSAVFKAPGSTKGGLK